MLPERAKNEKGAAMVEYALLVVGIAVVVGVAAAALGGRISAKFGSIIP
ncbi:Flp family type IVb pilin [Aeromicrobium terrae]|uniref:Flp family type IVb pilin n=2 Tax=Aeromicrobium terrae TaxID=2498846 RepID=A0A5C8NPL1_9ACTN|nr:Flp family type IVb pilin [Aeromicrobium terrae]